jgi:carbonic anhydrase
MPLADTGATSSVATWLAGVDEGMRLQGGPAARRIRIANGDLGVIMWPRRASFCAEHVMSFPQRLIEGYGAFRSERLPHEQHRYRDLAEAGQSPEVMVIGCCDSRVSPEVIFDAGPGELFVVRNVANIVPPYAPDEGAHGVSAALEFGVAALKVKHIVVLGHAHCGGVKAYATDAEPLSPGDFIGKWMRLMEPAMNKVGPRDAQSADDYLARLEQANVINSLDNLMTFPRLRKLIERGRVTVHGAYFAVATGELSVLDPRSGRFVPADIGAVQT